MTWKDRLQTAAITFPNGERFEFGYGDVEQELAKKTSKYTFGDIPGALVQDFGLGEIGFPLTVFLSGVDYDIDATNFEISASEKGISILEHPVYGIRDVVVESIRRRDPVRSSGGQAIFVLTMTQTIIEAAPESAIETRNLILSEQVDFFGINAEAFQLVFDVINDVLAARDRIQAFVDDIAGVFNTLLSTVQSIQTAFNEIERFITSNIDELLQAPLQLANSIQRLVQTPARLVASVKSRVDAYLESFDKLLNPATGVNSKNTLNQRLEKQLQLTSILSAISEVYLFPDTDGIGFQTRSDAIEAASELLSLYQEVQNFLDTEQQISLTDTLENRFAVSDSVVQAIKSITSSTSKNLIQLSFSLQQERIINTLKDRTILDLCFELYNTTTNDTLDFFIDSNRLTGEELLIIPKGKEIKYYV